MGTSSGPKWVCGWLMYYRLLAKNDVSFILRISVILVCYVILRIIVIVCGWLILVCLHYPGDAFQNIRTH